MTVDILAASCGGHSLYEYGVSGLKDESHADAISTAFRQRAERIEREYGLVAEVTLTEGIGEAADTILQQHLAGTNRLRHHHRPRGEGEGVVGVMKKIVFTPNAKQEAFFHAQTRYVAYGGARGGGKSWAMRMKLILLALRYEGISILLLRRTLGELRENHILPMTKILDGIAVYKESTKDFLFPNGSRIKLGYCDSESDVLQYQGQAYEVIGMEEATHFTYYQYLCLTECNRISGAMREPFTPRMYFTCNPGSRNPELHTCRTSAGLRRVQPDNRRNRLGRRNDRMRPAACCADAALPLAVGPFRGKIRRRL